MPVSNTAPVVLYSSLPGNCICVTMSVSMSVLNQSTDITSSAMNFSVRDMLLPVGTIVRLGLLGTGSGEEVIVKLLGGSVRSEGEREREGRGERG